jgi:uncharacterized protein
LSGAAKRDIGAREGLMMGIRWSICVAAVAGCVWLSASRAAQAVEPTAAPPSIAAAPTPAGGGPSFDCKRAAAPIEQAICADPALAALDRQLAATYARVVAPTSHWSAGDKQTQRAAQRAWRLARDTCATADDVKHCVASAYQQRLAALQVLSGEMTPLATAQYRCSGLARPATAVYYDKTDPPAALITVGDRKTVAFVTESGSGARYAAKDVELWEHHGEATLAWYGKHYHCTVAQ